MNGRGGHLSEDGDEGGGGGRKVGGQGWERRVQGDPLQPSFLLFYSLVGKEFPVPWVVSLR